MHASIDGDRTEDIEDEQGIAGESRYDDNAWIFERKCIRWSSWGRIQERQHEQRDVLN